MSRAVLLLAALVVLGCGERPAERWDRLVHEYVEGTFADDPRFAVSQGRHEFDGKIADLSPLGRERTIARLRDAREQALAFAARDLDDVRSFERDYLVAQIDGQLFWSERWRQHERSPLFYADAIDPSVYLTREYAPLGARLAAYVAHTAQIPGAIAQMQANLPHRSRRRSWRWGSRCSGGSRRTSRRTPSRCSPACRIRRCKQSSAR